jgi:hypothetical protein
VENENKPLLRSMYDMVKKVNRIGSLRDLLLEYTKNKGNQILTVENTNSYGHLQYLALMYEKSNSSYEQRHKANVGDLIRLRFRLESICEECFENDASLLGAVSDGYRIFMSGGTREVSLLYRIIRGLIKIKLCFLHLHYSWIDKKEKYFFSILEFNVSI